MANERIGVVVTTAHRGVFFGYVQATQPLDVETIRIEDARNCVRWVDTRGFMGLAATGPNNKCRIGPRVPSLTLQKVTSVAEASQAACDAWEKAPWSM